MFTVYYSNQNRNWYPKLFLTLYTQTFEGDTELVYDNASIDRTFNTILPDSKRNYGVEKQSIGVEVGQDGRSIFS